MPVGSSGVFAAVATPLGPDNRIDLDLLAGHCLAMIRRGMHGVAIFGTTGEGPSFTVDERRYALDGLLARGVEPEQLWVATGASALGDSIELTRHALSSGCQQVLLLPPFFFKGATSEGVVNAVSTVIDAVDDARLRVALYHIPQVAGIGFDDSSIDSLRERYGAVIAGIKDSCGQAENSLHWIERHPGLHVYVGAEDAIARTRAAGGAGSICGLANVIPEAIRALYDGTDTESAQEAVAQLLAAIAGQPFVPLLKRWLAQCSDNPGWARVRAPLVSADAARASPAVLASVAADGSRTSEPCT